MEYRRYYFESESEPGKGYLVDRLGLEIYCPCRGYRVETTRGNCTHVRQVRRLMESEMSESTALIPAEYRPIEVRPQSRKMEDWEVNQMKALALQAIKGGEMVPAGYTPDKVLAVMMRGREIGLPPMVSLGRIFIVNGRTEMDAQTMMGLVRAYDPTAEFRFSKYSHDEVEVALFRDGKLMIVVSYSEEDRARSRQGERKKRDMSVTKSGRNGTYHPYFDPPQWEIDPESPWFQYKRDMLAYNAVRRACRLGASDLINQIEGPGGFVGRPSAYVEPYTYVEPVPGDEAKPPLVKAIQEGKLSPDQALGKAEPQDPAIAEKEQAEREEDPTPENAPQAVQEPQEAAEGSFTEVEADGPASAEDVALITRAMTDAQKSWDGSFYLRMFQDFSKFMPNRKGPFNPAKLTAKAAHDCLVELRARQVIPPEQEDQVSEATQEKDREIERETVVEEGSTTVREGVTETPASPEDQEATEAQGQPDEEEDNS